MIKGIGVDVTEISRISIAIERSKHDFINKIFTEQEYNYCKDRIDNIPCLTARFAAKEATLKAFQLGLDKISLKSVEVVHEIDGSPAINILNKALEKIKMDRGISKIWLSISHSEHFVTAFVILESESQ